MRWHRVDRAALLLGCSLLIASCAEQPPAAVTTPAAPAPDQTRLLVVVERGQSLDRIARLYRVPKRDIIAANKLKPPYALRPGSVLQIPLAASEPAKRTVTRPTTATVKPDRSAETTAPAPRRKAKRPAPEVIPLD